MTSTREHGAFAPECHWLNATFYSGRPLALGPHSVIAIAAVRAGRHGDRHGHAGLLVRDC